MKKIKEELLEKHIKQCAKNIQQYCHIIDCDSCPFMDVNGECGFVNGEYPIEWEFCEEVRYK